MTHEHNGPRHVRKTAFTLIELLTVIFIISLLLAILIPSLSSARNAAKKGAGRSMFKAIGDGLEMFRNDHESQFRQTNGYPPSFAHPQIGNTFQPHLGQFPFVDPPVTAFGAHWLPAMLIGTDALGYVSRKDVPNKKNLRNEPWKWYDANPLDEDQGTILPRSPLYVDPGGLRLVKTGDLAGRPNPDLFPGWEESTLKEGIKSLPVIVDPWEQPVLYYVANKFGRGTNMVEDRHEQSNQYDVGQTQQNGPPYYFHQDNEGFTGNDEDDTGWNFAGGLNSGHAIADSGHKFSASRIVHSEIKEVRETFARFILDKKVLQSLASKTDIVPNTQLRPVNHDSYLLISPGVDQRYGTPDDLTNFPLE